MYDISNFLSQVDFRDYLTGAILLYDSVKEEITVSNSNYKYSYTCNLRTELWHKLSCVFTHSSGKYALKSVSTTNSDVVDTSIEEITGTKITHLQTRPLKLSKEGYKTVYRAVLRGEIYPDTNPFGTYIFGSDNLIDWNMICARQTEMNVASLKMLRSLKSYRYFVIVLGGTVDLAHNVAHMDIELMDKQENKER